MRWTRWVSTLPLRFRSLFKRNRVEQELNDEMQYHLDRQVEEFIAKGMPPKDARYAALRAMDGMEQRKEECRDTRGINIVDNLIQDLRYGFRGLRKNPRFAFVAILTIALGIAANTTLFSIVDPILFKPLPFPQPDRLVRLYRTLPGFPPEFQRGPHSVSNYLDYHDKNNVFEHLAAFNHSTVSMAEPGEPAEILSGIQATAEFFPALEISPQIGRVYTNAEDRPGADHVAILSYRFWMTRFAGDPRILDRTLRLNGQNTTIIGVMPRNFEYAWLLGTVDVWQPIAFTADQRQQRANSYLGVIGRIKSDLPFAQADSGMKALATQLAEQHPENDKKSTLRLEPLQHTITSNSGRQFFAFAFGLTGLVMFIACVNLANLQLARTTTRSREFAVRGSLGGSRWRLMRQSLTESLILSLAGGTIALPTSIWSVAWISNRLFAEEAGIAFDTAHGYDIRAYAFALSCAIVTGIIFGAVPAWIASRSDVNEVLKQNPRGATSNRSQQRFRQTLIVAEIAFALIVLASAGGMIRGMRRLAMRIPGWRVDGVLIGGLNLNGPDYANPKKRAGIFDQLQQRIAALPGVEGVTIASCPPTDGFSSVGDIIVEGRAERESLVFSSSVDTQYFKTLGIPLLQGRVFDSGDKPDRPNVVVIGETMARRIWPDQDPIGKRISLVEGNPSWWEVVGVVSDVKFPWYFGQVDIALQAYRPLAQEPLRTENINIRTAIKPETLAPDVRRIVAELDRDIPFGARTAQSMVELDMSGMPLLARVLGAFAALGLVLAAIGIFGVVSYSVAQRTGEIGIRMALGARRSEVLRLVLKQGAILILFGTILGMTGGFAVARVLSSRIPWLPTADTITLLGVTGCVVVVALVSCYIPAHRASKIDPMIALRHE